MNDFSNQTRFRLEESNKIEDTVIAEISEREQKSKKLSKHVAAFDYFDKIAIVLAAASGEASIISFTTNNKCKF